MSHRYANLLSPLKVGNVVLKNRMLAAVNPAHVLIQGDEGYPNESTILVYADRARNGAAAVSVTGINGRGLPGTKVMHPHMLDMYDYTCQRHLRQVADAVHFYDSKAMLGMMTPDYGDYGVVSGETFEPRSGEKIMRREMPREVIEQLCSLYAEMALLGKGLGFDMCNLSIAYLSQLPGHFFSKLTNTRTDEFGGSLENRARFTLMICEAIKKACGWDYPIELTVSAEDEATPLEDMLQFAKLAEGYVDILQVRPGSGRAAHPSTYDYPRENHIPTLHYDEALRSVDTKVKIELIGGAWNPDENERLIAEGKCDLIGMTRAYISNSDYGKAIYEGRGEDVVPCLQCNGCHGNHCAINPEYLRPTMKNHLIVPNPQPRKLAVVGGGIAGMQAAITAAKRGHEVTLYEKSGQLGGHLRHSDYMDFKWAFQDYMNHMVSAVERAGVNVRLNTQASPELLQGAGYDAVFAAIGGVPSLPEIPGVDGENVTTVYDCYRDAQRLGERVVVAGENPYTIEIAEHLTRLGKKVVLITPAKSIRAMPGATRYLQTYLNTLVENFEYHEKAELSAIDPTGVNYTDAEGEHRIDCDSVVLATEHSPLTDEALAYYAVTPRVTLIGDCSGGTGIRNATTTAYCAASAL